MVPKGNLEDVLSFESTNSGSQIETPLRPSGKLKRHRTLIFDFARCFLQVLVFTLLPRSSIKIDLRVVRPNVGLVQRQVALTVRFAVASSKTPQLAVRVVSTLDARIAHRLLLSVQMDSYRSQRLATRVLMICVVCCTLNLSLSRQPH